MGPGPASRLGRRTQPCHRAPTHVLAMFTCTCVQTHVCAATSPHGKVRVWGREGAAPSQGEPSRMGTCSRAHCPGTGQGSEQQGVTGWVLPSGWGLSPGSGPGRPRPGPLPGPSKHWLLWRLQTRGWGGGGAEGELLLPGLFSDHRGRHTRSPGCQSSPPTALAPLAAPCCWAQKVHEKLKVHFADD